MGRALQGCRPRQILYTGAILSGPGWNDMTLQRFNLRAKFTIMLVLVFLGGIVLSAAVLIQALQRRAEAEVTSKGLLLLQTMNAVRYYTSTHVNPLLAP